MKRFASKLISALISFVIFSATCVVLTVPAHAYIDPSVTTYAIQAIAGVAVAVGAFVAVYWRRAKNAVKKKFGGKETAAKNTEEDLGEIELDGMFDGDEIRFDADGLAALDAKKPTEKTDETSVNAVRVPATMTLASDAQTQLHIHISISPENTPEQIDQIFASIAKHLSK